MSDLLDRQNYIMKSIAQQYTNSLKTKSINTSSVVTNQLNIDCGDKCKDCLKLFINETEMTDNYLKNKNFIDYIKKNNCSYLCICSAKSIFQDSTLIFAPETSITTDDVNTNQIATNVVSDIETKYNFPSKVEDIKNIIVSIQENVVQNINQLIRSSNIIELKGAGTLNNIKVVSSIDAVMKAIVTNSSAVGSITNVVNQMVTDIKDEINKEAAFSVKKIILENSKMLIGLGSLSGLLFIIIIVLLIVKATR